MGTLFGIKAFAAAILGGIESAWGVVLAGLIYGVAEALITALLGLDLHPDRDVHARHPGSRLAAERPIRACCVEEGRSSRATVAAAIVIARRMLPYRSRQWLSEFHHRHRRTDRDRRHRPQRPRWAERSDFARACGVLCHRRLRRAHPDHGVVLAVLAGARRRLVSAPDWPACFSPYLRCACVAPIWQW